MMHLPTNLLNRFQELIYQKCSLNFSASRLINFETQLRERTKDRGLDSYEEYFKLLKNDDQEMNTLIEKITTKETYFFRLPGQFDVLQNKVLPQIEELLSKQALSAMVEDGGPGPWKIPLRIWSAACATGEEPSSIAMCVNEGLEYPRAWQLEITASDISREAITTAGLGSYDKKILDAIPNSYHDEHLSVLADSVMISKQLLDKIDYRLFNLGQVMNHNGNPNTFQKTDGSTEALNLSERFHIIFCRNVMIYFDLKAQQDLINGLYKCLVPGGYLFTGDAELLHIHEHKFETLEHQGTYYYRKPGQ